MNDNLFNEDLSQSFIPEEPEADITFNELGELNGARKFDPDQSIMENQINEIKNKGGKGMYRTTGKRPNRDIDSVEKAIKDGFDDLAIDNRTYNYYNRLLLDMVINGNYRIKYIPNAATRDLAAEYCKKHRDDNGFPQYRLLPPNAEDPKGIPITDLNGDKVDDIVIVNKQGAPVIVNGYKLVRADPYKKAWQTMFDSAKKRKETPFNDWLNQQFSKSIEDVDWDAGKYNIKKLEDIETYEKAYSTIGLGKPKIRTAVKPSSLWSSIFAHIWKLFWQALPIRDKVQNHKRVVKYLPISNLMFMKLIDIECKEEIEKTKYNKKRLPYDSWVVVRKMMKTEYNKTAGELLTGFLKLVKQVLNLQTGQIIEKDNRNWPENFKNFMNELTDIIFEICCGIKYTKENIPAITAQSKQFGNSSPEQIKRIAEEIQKRIDIYVDRTIYEEGCGYIEYKANKMQEAEAKKANADLKCKIIKSF